MARSPLSATHEAILDAWRCAIGSDRVIYLSGPISTGRRFVDAVSLGSARALAGVVRDNSRDLLLVAERLRKERQAIVIEPSSLEVTDWSQGDYHALWERFIRSHVRTVAFMPGWEYSIGCIAEYRRAIRSGIATESVSGSPLSPGDALAALKAAAVGVRAVKAKHERLAALLSKQTSAVSHLANLLRPRSQSTSRTEVRKDAQLDALARDFNVAQFVSFAPESGKPKQGYSRVTGESPNQTFPSVRHAIERLLQTSPERSVNVRSYEPGSPQSREFVYGLRSIEEVVATVDRLTGENLHTIVNETVDVTDGGVSGVVLGNIIEFSPDDTPRAVEKPGTAMFPREWGRDALSQVYGIPLSFDFPLNGRLEFSIHPRPRGWRNTNLLAWEYSEGDFVPTSANVRWPNRFSRLIGDKVFGLLVAHFSGLPVPRTTVINRRIAPFSFGVPTGTGETWIRTAPVEQVPGKFTTHRGWVDPFKLLMREDPSGNSLASVLAQDGVTPEFSGALIVGRNGEVIVEGKRGEGETLMLGASGPEKLPPSIRQSVTELLERARRVFGEVRFEWVHDGIQPWIVQMHAGATESSGAFITNELAREWVEFDITRGLETLRTLVQNLEPGTGIALSGNVGLTSHFADVLRKARVPARIRAA